MIDWTKPIQTRAGLPARMLATDIKSKNGNCICVAVTYPSGNEVVSAVTLEGLYYSNPSDADIINVPEKRVRYLNIYPGSIYSYNNREDADTAAKRHDNWHNRIACIKVEYMEGQLDD